MSYPEGMNWTAFDRFNSYEIEEPNADEQADMNNIKSFVEALLALAARAEQWSPYTGLGKDAQAALVNALDDAMADLTQARKRLEGRE